MLRNLFETTASDHPRLQLRHLRHRLADSMMLKCTGSLWLAVSACLSVCDQKSSNSGGLREVVSAEKSPDLGPVLGNSSPTAAHERIDESTVGQTLDDAVEKFGRWDLVGDVMGDERGQLYPFSGRNGFDYLVRVDTDGNLNGAWKRPQSLKINSQPVEAPEAE